MITKELNINDFDYPLPSEKIAKYPLKERDSSKLLHFQGNKISERRFVELPQLISKDDFLVFNNTKVIQARLRMNKSSGAEIEIFCLEPLEPSEYHDVFQSRQRVVWKVMVGNLRRWKGERLQKELDIKGKKCVFEAEYIRELGNMSHEVIFRWSNAEITFGEILESMGELPIPPYLNRKTEAPDLETYQTKYAKELGSVAAPTAGLHFSPEVFSMLKQRGINTSEVTLHIGAGTFQPVKHDDVREHQMHSEMFFVSLEELRRLLQNLGHIVAVGTTSVRTLESLYYIGNKIHKNPLIQARDIEVSQWEAYEDSSELTTQESLQEIIGYLERNELEYIQAKTTIMIVPSFRFRIVSKMITNFHQPKSTLLLLVSAFIGIENQRKIYQYALDNEFRFLSYGDSSLLEPNVEQK